MDHLSRSEFKSERYLTHKFKEGSSRHLVLMVGAGLAIRLIAVLLLYREQLSPQWDYFSFGWENGRVARSIVSGQGFSSPMVLPTGPTAIVPPLYPFLLAGV